MGIASVNRFIKELEGCSLIEMVRQPPRVKSLSIECVG